VLRRPIETTAICQEFRTICQGTSLALEFVSLDHTHSTRLNITLMSSLVFQELNNDPAELRRLL
jgi:hypothetical protein